jgi:hypothetical protein
MRENVSGKVNGGKNEKIAERVKTENKILLQ